VAAKDGKTQAQDTVRERQDNLQVGKDNTDDSADTVQYAADVGFTVTSHGDGTPSISPQLVERRKFLKEFNANPDRENEELAKSLKVKK
jgi:hypothetical protein